MSEPIIPLFGPGEIIAQKQRERINKAADAVVQKLKDQTGNDTRLMVLALLHAFGYVVARSEPALDQEFVNKAQASIPLYVNAYRQDGPGRVFS